MSIHVAPHLVGYPRIGADRELKKALESAWGGKTDNDQLETTVTQLRQAHIDEQIELVGTAIDDFWLYDEVLETAMMLGIVPEHLTSEQSAFAVLTQLARGSKDHEAWEMTKWFDTNYHYVVPEVERSVTGFTPLPWRKPVDGVRWSVLGPYSLAKLSKCDDSSRLAAEAGAALFRWIKDNSSVQLQLNEPCLGLTMDDADQALLEAAYATADGVSGFVTVQFGAASPGAIELLAGKGFIVQVPVHRLAALASTDAWSALPGYLVSVMDGRSVWADDFSLASDGLASVDFGDKPVHITPSTSLMFLPYTVAGEDLPDGLQFAREKAASLRKWAAALTDGTSPDTPAAVIPDFPDVRDVESRAERADRKAAQANLNLPPFPTTTTGSLPQTAEVRKNRADFKAGKIDQAAYEAKIDEMMLESIRWQEDIGLDALVHGEFERTDMVEFFGERMDGMFVTNNGWVLSYGSRCVRPPIIAAPPSIPEPMTVREWKVAQAATDKPVKGMLTGPVTIVNWSFRPPGVPDDRLFWAVGQPIAQEVAYLVEAGARMIQIDEPAVRERWPLQTDEAEELRKVYSRGVRSSLRRVFTAPPEVQLHTHMCYGDFSDIVPLWSDVGVDVASIEWSRSKDDAYIDQFYNAFSDGTLQIGPGVFDVHSPHSPGAQVMEERLAHFLSFMDATDLWVNPDCGLKTRAWEHIEVQLKDLVQAAEGARNA